MGATVFAGVDYESILRAAEAEADVIIWDGGNNDMPFIREEKIEPRDWMPEGYRARR
jgi:predicted GTPase